MRTTQAALWGVIGAGATLALACTTSEVRIAHAPNAFAGYDATGIVGATVPLDGSESTDPDGLALSYAWKLEVTPAGSKASIAAPDAPATSFIPDLAGSYVASLTVSNGSLASRDLVSIFGTTGTTAPALDLRFKLHPAICNVDLDHLDLNTCAAAGAIMISATIPDISATDAAAARILWTAFRVPQGVGAMDPGIGAPVSFAPLILMPSAPGEYWVSAQLLVRNQISPPAFASVGVFAGPTPIEDRPIAMIDARDSAQIGERVLFDGTGSTLPQAGRSGAAVHFAWTLFVDPSNGGDLLSDAATGCPQDQCRVLVPTSKGTYLIALHVAIGDLDGASALFALEVN